MVHTVGQLLLERLQDCRNPLVKEWLLTAADALIYADKVTGKNQLKTPFVRQLWAFTVNSVSLNHCVESANALLTTLIRYWSGGSRGGQSSTEGIEHLEKLYALFTTKLVTPNEHTVKTLVTLQVGVTSNGTVQGYSKSLLLFIVKPLLKSCKLSESL